MNWVGQIAGKKLVLISIAVTVSLVLVGCAIFPPPKEITYHGLEPAADQQSAHEIRITTWNLGYAGLGKEQDFKADGGKSLRSRDRRLNKIYAESIVQKITELDSEILLFQEAAFPSFINHRTNLIGMIVAALPNRFHHFTSSYRISMPFGLGVHTGLMMSLVNAKEGRFEVIALPDGESAINFGRHFPGQIHRAQIQGTDVTIINAHLSAFDKNAVVRKKQLAALLEIGVKEEKKGRLVIIGGDFNMEFSPSPAPYDTHEKYLEWVQPFPEEALPEGWRLVSSETTPTVRSLERPYRQGRNYTGIIDGFIISPQACVTGVIVENLNFAYTDHHPVSIIVNPKSQPSREKDCVPTDEFEKASTEQGFR